MIRKKKGPRLRVSPAAVCMGAGTVVTALLGGGVTTAAPGATLLAVLCHEGGHLVLLRLCGVRLSEITLDLFGARLRLEGMPSYRQEAWIAAGGPLCNLLCLLWLTPVAPAHPACPFLEEFLAASAGLALVNLLPVATLDGGRILSCLLSCLCGDEAARRCLRLTTGLALLALWMLAVYALLRAGRMLSLFVFSLCLLLRACSGEAF